MLASPFVGVSNDALVLIRRHAGRRPLYTGIERSLPEALSSDDERLLRAFKQRYDRLVAASARLSLERLSDEIVAAHDYDLAVLARWDGKRRYANLRKLMRLARSYEGLRGADIEGFVGFIRDQEAVGASQLEAVSEEEGADAVRLLTIHAAKGLEFKVVIVADAGRDTGGAPSSDEILVRPDGSFGFRVIDPRSGKRKGVFDYDAVRAAERREDDAERLRLYYVAMTRAIDRLIVSGAVDLDRAQDRDTPIGWVLDRLAAATEVEAAADAPVELERGDSRFVLSVDRARRAPPAEPLASVVAEGAQLELFDELPTGPAPRGYRLPELVSAACCTAPPGSAPLVLRARSLRTLFVSLLRGTGRGAPRDARGRRRARLRGPEGDRGRRCGPPPARACRPRIAGDPESRERARVVSGRDRRRARADRVVRRDVLRVGARGADRRPV